jgi:hypothetical protein
MIESGSILPISGIRLSKQLFVLWLDNEFSGQDFLFPA